MPVPQTQPPADFLYLLATDDGKVSLVVGAYHFPVETDWVLARALFSTALLKRAGPRASGRDLMPITPVIAIAHDGELQLVSHRPTELPLGISDTDRIQVHIIEPGDVPLHVLEYLIEGRPAGDRARSSRSKQMREAIAASCDDIAHVCRAFAHAPDYATFAQLTRRSGRRAKAQPDGRRWDFTRFTS